MSLRASITPWVLVAGGFHQAGGMDRTNAALARYLHGGGVPLELVGYRADQEFTNDAGIKVHLVHKPRGSFFLGEYRLDLRGRRVAAAALARDARTRVMVNGTNCRWDDLNWVHFVHHAWSPRSENASTWLRAKMRLERDRALRRERRILTAARLLIANSEGTRRDLIGLGVSPQRIATVYPGCDFPSTTAAPLAKAAARRRLGVAGAELIVCFVGAFGHDCRKGFDTLVDAWRRLMANHNWRATLLAAGDGRALDFWRRRVRAAGLDAQIKLLGFSSNVEEVLAASDLLVSPVRYEPYGLNVHEAIACGVPAIVSACAGVAERYPAELRALLLKDPDNAHELAQLLALAAAHPTNIKYRFKSFAEQLRAADGADMALRIVAAVQQAQADLRDEPRSAVSEIRI